MKTISFFSLPSKQSFNDVYYIAYMIALVLEKAIKIEFNWITSETRFAPHRIYAVYVL